MPRRYRRYYRRSYVPRAIKRYSNETTNFFKTFSVSSATIAQNSDVVIPVSSAQGVRKVKNFTLTLTGTPFTLADDASAINIPLIWALVYVPEGTSPSNLNIGSSSGAVSLYEPNQNVIMCGQWPPTLTTPYTVRSSLARNLNSGDSIYLVYANMSQYSQDMKKAIGVTLNYAIAY